MSCCDTTHPMTSTGAFTACVPGALPGGLSRTRFFDGMVLTQADFENEQLFWRIKRRLTNRALGTGVVWGLRLRWDAKQRAFALGPGYALDCCGNDLVVECPVTVTESQLLGVADPSIKTEHRPDRWGRAQAPLRHACVVLQYVECPEDARPVHLDPCAPPTSRCEASRVRETTRLMLVPPPSAPPPDCFDEFFAGLQALKDSIDNPQLRDELFPPPPSAPPSPFPNDADAKLPATLTITSPGDGPSTTTSLELPANGTVNGPSSPISGTRTPSALRAGVIQFELKTSAGWGFYEGMVSDGNTVVDKVAPPLDLHQFWALEITLPDNSERVEKDFEYAADLGIEQMGGERSRGSAKLVIRGHVSVRPDGQRIRTDVTNVSVEVRSEVAERADRRGCFEELATLWAADPEHADRDVRLLYLAAIYAFFAEMSARGTNQNVQYAASLLYIIGWRLLRVDVRAAGEAERQELARLLGQLYECWCDAMLYPGPRCSDEHHGVYLGCATIGPGGRIVSFDMWEGRRQVLLGPVFNHWLGVFRIAPIDVIFGRIASTICCIAGLPTPKLSGRFDSPDNRNTIFRIDFGNGNVVGYPRMTSGPTRDVGTGGLVWRILSAFVADAATPLAKYRTRLADGTTVEVMSPGATDGKSSGAVDARIEGALRREPPPPLARAAVRLAVAEIARDSDPAALPELRGASAELARALAGTGMSVAGVVEAGAEGVLAAVPSADPVAIDDIVTRAEGVIDAITDIVGGAARRLAPATPAVLLRDAELRKAIAPEIKKRVGLTRQKLDAALDRAVTQSA